MNIIVSAAIAAAIGTGVVGVTSSSIRDPHKHVISEGDKAFAWREASGAQGEQEAASIPLFSAVIDGDERQLKDVLAKGTSPNQLLYPGRWSALMIAAAHNEREIAQILIEHGANVNYKADDQVSPTPLAVALEFGVPHQDLSIFRDLLAHGADMSARYPDAEDAVIHAAVLGQMDLVNELLQRGYRRDLPQLEQALEIIHVDEEREPAKQRAITTVKKLLNDGSQRNGD